MIEFPIVVALVVASVQLFKMFDFNKKLTPVFALVAGIAIAILAGAGTGAGIGEQVLNGLIAAFSAMGIWSGAKTELGKK